MIIKIPYYAGYGIEKDKGLIYSYKTKKFLKTHLNNKGYLRTTISINGVRLHIFNHITLVATVGDCNGNTFNNISTSLRGIGMSIDHLNGDKTDPSRNNLELVTHSVNVKRMYDRKSCILEDIV